MATTKRESERNQTRPPRREEMRSRSRQRSPRRDRSRPRRQSPGRQTTTAGIPTPTPVSTTPMITSHQKKYSYGYHPSLVAGLTLFFIILIIVVAVIVKTCLHRKRKTKAKAKTEDKKHAKRISSYKMYSEVDQSVFLADRVSEADVKHLRGPEHDSIEEYLKKNDDSQDSIDFDEQNSGPNSGNNEVKYDYAESPKDQENNECKTGSDEHQYDYASHPIDQDSLNGTGNGNGGGSPPVINRTDNDGYFVLEKEINT